VHPKWHHFPLYCTLLLTRALSTWGIGCHLGLISVMDSLKSGGLGLVVESANLFI
jgi:hypothetical protein